MELEGVYYPFVVYVQMMKVRNRYSAQHEKVYKLQVSALKLFNICATRKLHGNNYIFQQWLTKDGPARFLNTLH